ncbi:MAG: diadenylate cyclase CdaA [Clostridia bacterium]|nr:diadenylate cyclase CdaA [Clostridia bacterium]
MPEIIDVSSMDVFLKYIWSYFSNFSFLNFARVILDLGIVTFVLYKVLKVCKDTRAWQLIKGIIFTLIFSYVCELLSLNTIAYILNYLISFMGIALVVIFSPEIRRILEQLGRNKLGLSSLLNLDQKSDTRIVTKLMIDNVVAAAQNMSLTRTGALMVIERNTKVGEYINTGTRIDSEVSASLLINIFVPNTPLHDGAVIIRDNRIVAAGCVLPLTDKQVDNGLGTRHRAAIGITDVSDAVVVVVSEETSQISLCYDGKINRDLTREVLREKLGALLIPEETKTSFSIFSRKDRKK